MTERGATKKRPLSRALSAGLLAGFWQLYIFCEKENFGQDVSVQEIDVFAAAQGKNLHLAAVQVRAGEAHRGQAAVLVGLAVVGAGVRAETAGVGGDVELALGGDDAAAPCVQPGDSEYRERQCEGDLPCAGQ